MSGKRTKMVKRHLNKQVKQSAETHAQKLEANMVSWQNGEFLRTKRKLISSAIINVVFGAVIVYLILRNIG